MLLSPATIFLLGLLLLPVSSPPLSPNSCWPSPNSCWSSGITQHSFSLSSHASVHIRNLLLWIFHYLSSCPGHKTSLRNCCQCHNSPLVYRPFESLCCPPDTCICDYLFLYPYKPYLVMYAMLGVGLIYGIISGRLHLSVPRTKSRDTTRNPRASC
ncbi:hypothetical protein P280DRAFT_193922 [Massarina eburnea CBS 473.64]|uniref:Uncharacterized protein n=1 Tax=Massarina eburnea CBS 473.64 TaxID=1395130 RepID=A0A6A6RK56_9PLEO|nr:hypothetical protein P280DRAFT_193922 [Massarina eburnea CBS 473.64]